MNEMLANQYFIVSRFQDACLQFEEILKVNSSNTIVKKKLILCYIHMGKIKSAFKLFSELITTDINTLTTSEINIYDQPCKKMITLMNDSSSIINDSDRSLILGMLWTFCDVQNAKSYFEKLNRIEPNNSNIITILTIINHLISQKKRK